MRTGAIRREVRSSLARLSDADLDPTVYRHQALALLRRAVGFDAWCWTLVDPGSGLPSHAIADNPAVARNPARFHQLIYGDDAGLCRSDALTADAAVSLLSQSTGGNLDTNPQWREVLGPAGLGDRLDAALVAGRLCWGHLSLYRDADRGWFTESDRAFIVRARQGRGAQSSRSRLGPHDRLVSPTPPAPTRGEPCSASLERGGSSG